MQNLHVLHLNLSTEEDSIEEEVCQDISFLQDSVDELKKSVAKLPKEE